MKSKNKVITYNLKDLTEQQAKEKGKVFFKVWQQFMENINNK